MGANRDEVCESLVWDLITQCERTGFQDGCDLPPWDEVIQLYAFRLAEVAGKLTLIELAGLAKIGMIIHRKTRDT
jgi:hypothetical protein